MSTKMMPLSHLRRLVSAHDRSLREGLFAAMAREIEAAQGFEAFVEETWKPGQQALSEAYRVAGFLKASIQRFEAFKRYACSLDCELEDSFHEAIAHFEGVYYGLLRVCEDNIRVADGRGRRRDDDPPDDFIGPTGHISF